MNATDETVLSLWHGRIPKNRTYTGRIGRTIAQIAADVALKHDVTVDDLIGPARTRWISHARQELMWFAYEERRADGTRVYSLPSIGKYLGGRDHTTVLHGILAHERRVKVNVAA
jgi:chromosomal replication initiation ATPase DnaA